MIDIWADPTDILFFFLHFHGVEFIVAFDRTVVVGSGHRSGVMSEGRHQHTHSFRLKRQADRHRIIDYHIIYFPSHFTDHMMKQTHKYAMNSQTVKC